MADLLNFDLYIKDSFLYFADIDFAFIVPKTQRVNTNVTEYKLVRIDRPAKANGISRSAFCGFCRKTHQEIGYCKNC